MKKVIIFSLLLSSFVAIFNSCRKEDNVKLPDLTRAPLPLVTKDPSADDVISGSDPAAFAGKVVVDMYFPNDIKPQKADVVVIRNGDNASVKTIQADVTSFPTTVAFTGTQLETLFGVPIVAGDNFTVGVDLTTTDGLKYEAFPITGLPYASGTAAQPGSSTTVQYVAVCEFNKAAFNGNYTVVQDDWADFAVGDFVEVKPGAGDNEISILAYPSPAYGTNRKPMIITVNPTTYEVTIPEQVIGDYNGAPPGATARGTGTVNPCGDEISLLVTINIGGDDYEDNVLVLHK